jgi:hypothetical protein
MRENLSNKIDQVVDLYRHHVRSSALSLHQRGGRIDLQRFPAPAPVFMTGLAGTLSEKLRVCLPLRP